MGRCIEHHLDDSLDITVDGYQPADIHAEPLCDGGPDLVTIELFALDLTRTDYVFGQRAQLRFTTQVEAHVLHPAQETALLTRDLAEQSGKAPAVPDQVRPVLPLPDVHLISAFCAEIMAAILRRDKNNLRASCGDYETHSRNRANYPANS